MEMEDIYANVEHNNCNSPVKEDLDEDEDIYINEDTLGSQKQSCSQNESKAQIQVQQTKITAEREIKLNYKNMAEEFNQSVHRMQVNYSDLTIEKDQLQSSFNSLSQKKLEVEAELMKKNSQRGYQFVNEYKSWSDSRKFCRDRGGDLIIINTEEKQRFISSLIKENVWIGLSDMENEGNMRWVDNSPLRRGFWMVNEPNDADKNEDCVEMIPSLPPEKNWNDLPCSAKKRWICEN